MFAQPAHAIDKRLKLMFKTAGYGAAAGALVGAGTFALGLGGFRNVLMGASSGMYAGILLAAYIVATPDENPSARRKMRNPYAPRPRAEPGEMEDQPEDEYKQMLPPDQDNQGTQILKKSPQRAEIVMWAPLVSLHF